MDDLEVNKIISFETAEREAAIARLSAWVESAISGLSARIDAAMHAVSIGDGAQDLPNRLQLGLDDTRKNLSRLSEVQAQQEERMRKLSHSFDQLSLSLSSTERDQKATFREIANNVSELGCKFGHRIARLEEAAKQSLEAFDQLPLGSARTRERSTSSQIASSPLIQSRSAQTESKAIVFNAGAAEQSNSSCEVVNLEELDEKEPAVADKEMDSAGISEGRAAASRPRRETMPAQLSINDFSQPSVPAVVFEEEETPLTTSPSANYIGTQSVTLGARQLASSSSWAHLSRPYHRGSFDVRRVVGNLAGPEVASSTTVGSAAMATLPLSARGEVPSRHHREAIGSPIMSQRTVQPITFVTMPLSARFPDRVQRGPTLSPCASVRHVHFSHLWPPPPAHAS